MGSFSQIMFGGYPIFENKNYYYPEIVNLLFQPNDFVVEKRPYSSKNILVWGDSYKDEAGDFEFKGFKQTAGVCKQRLAIFGNSIKKSKNDFLEAKKLSKSENVYAFSLSGITFDKYLQEISEIISIREKNYNEIDLNFRDSLTHNNLSIWGQSIECILFSILSVLPDDDIVEYDLTDVYDGGWVDEEQAKNIDFEKIIILTEGKTDVEFISKSIEKLYPYLKEYYHFIDFEEYKIESNASALVKLVKSFAAANVKHPLIALFDNDTTGLMEMSKLKSIALPSNIRVLKYPDISLAKKYPTVGPTGIKRMNVNGSACGIELFFGIDVLTNENELIPIRWKSYNENLRKYQGELRDKHIVQDKFREKLRAKSKIGYTEMNFLLNEIFCAFN